MQVVYDVVRSLARHGFRRILLINGHKWTNLPALTSAARNIREFELPGVRTAVADPMYLARGIATAIKHANEHHAGELEVSHVRTSFRTRSGRRNCRTPPVISIGCSGRSERAICSVPVGATRSINPGLRSSRGARRQRASFRRIKPQPRRPESSTTTTWSSGSLSFSRGGSRTTSCRRPPREAPRGEGGELP